MLQALDLKPLGLIFDKNFGKTVRKATTRFVKYHDTILEIGMAIRLENAPETELGRNQLDRSRTP